MLLWVQYCFIGAISCWGPEVILAVLFRRSSADWEIAKAFLPLCTCAAYLLVRNFRSRSASGPSLAGCMLLGIYVLGPWFIEIESTILGSGFHNVRSLSDWMTLIVLSLNPIYTFVMSTYDVSFFGLIVVTTFLAVAHWKWESKGWVLPFGHLKKDGNGGA